jgi:acid phosphatase type 7
MKRREFIRHTAAASLALGVGTVDAAAQPKRNPPKPKAPPPPVAGTTPPVLQAVSETGVTIFWTASSAATGWVEYGETPALGQVARGGVEGLLPYDDRVLRVRLSNLQPGRTYHYRVQTAAFDFTHPYSVGRGAPQPGPIFSFQTLSAAAAEVNFVVWNDTHQNQETLRKLAEQLPRFPADFLFWNGDIFNFIGSDESLLAETLHPAGLAYAATRPVLFSRGNHDVRGNHARSLGRAVEAPGGHYYHQFRQGPVAFVVLDTGEDKPDDHPEYGGLADFARYRTEQVPWLEAAVARPEFATAPFRILFTHIPLRGHAECADGREKWEPLLRRAKVDLAISGHTHRYAHLPPTPEQPWPLLVGGGPSLPGATFIHVHATAEQISYRMFGADARPLGDWQVKRAG